MNVYIGGAKDYSAMQGPCDNGYHIPLQSEMLGLYNMMINDLSNTTKASFIEKLHLPATGYLSNSDGTFGGSGTWAYYQTSSAILSGSSVNTYRLVMRNSDIVFGSSYASSLGGPIRPFKNSFVVPASDWTVIQGTLGGAGIFRNQTDGIISITSDGTTGYTIADKNLGATTVYSDGDTLAEANCGKLYQRGNNYGFAWNTTPTTSSTSVDASTYGPGNYYSSSTFITYNWDNSNNLNLRGGVTGIVSPAALKDAYIGEYITILEYDFTQSDAGWTKSSSGVNRSSSGFYVSGAYASGGLIFPPSEVYQGTPKKIKIDLNRSNTSNTGTGIWNNGLNYWYFLPRNSSTIRLDWNYNGTITQNSVLLGIGDITWELDIDSSTTNWTVTHKITGNNNITDTGGVLKYIWNNQLFGIRLIYWNNTSGVGPYIKKVTIEY